MIIEDKKIKFKGDLIREVAKRSDVTIKDTAVIVDNVFKVLSEYIADENIVRILNFGSFDFVEYVCGKTDDGQAKKIKKVKFTTGEHLSGIARDNIFVADDHIE